MTHHEVVRRLIGRFYPMGESSADEERFENLKQLCHLTEMLLMDIADLGHSLKDDQRASVKKCADYANKFIKETLEQFNTQKQ